jgi:hypothetical protein
MRICQRGVGGSFAGVGYFVDGWFKSNVGGTHTLYHTSPALGTTLDSETVSVIQSVVASQAATTDYVQILHRVENVRTLAGKQATLSFTAKTLGGTAPISIEIVQSFGTGGSPSASVLIAIQAFTLSATYTRYSVTFTIPSVSGKVIGTNNDDYLSINFWQSAGSSFAVRASSIGIQNTNIFLGDVQLEAGSVASPFERLSQQAQLAWCQRYFQRWAQPPLRGGVGSAGNTSTRIGMVLPVTMRANPICTMVGSLPVWDGFASTTLSSLGVQYTTPQAIEFDANSTISLGAGRALMVYQLGNASTYLDVTAEL